MSKVRNLDAYPKINEDFYSRTLSGGVITIVSSIVMLLLFVSELSKLPFFLLRCNLLLLMIWLKFDLFTSGLYLHAVTETKLVVDTSRAETLRINVISFLLFLSNCCCLAIDLKKLITTLLLVLEVQFDVTFPALPCSILSLDAMDISGEQHLDVVCIATKP